MFATSKTWRPTFKRILQSLRPHPRKDPGDNPLGLSPAQVDSLRQLVAHPPYKAYQQLLELVAEQLLNEFVRGMPHEQYLAKCGELKMLERLIELPHVILDKVTKLEDRTNARQQQHADARAARAHTYVSTPFWDGYIQSRPD